MKSEAIYKLLLDRDLRENDDTDTWGLLIVSESTDLRWLPALIEQDNDAFQRLSIVKIHPKRLTSKLEVELDYDTADNVQMLEEAFNDIV